MFFNRKLPQLVFLFMPVFSALAQPQADFKSDKNSGCVPVSVLFTDLSTGNPTSWEWDFGNGQTSKLQNPGITYTSAGKYTIRLTVYNANGSSTKVKTDFIVVYSNPTASFKVDKNVQCVNKPISFTDLSSKGNSGIASWYWDFGDGTKSNQKNPVHNYSSGGLYQITLIVTDSNNCTDNIVMQNAVEIKDPKADFKADKTAFCSSPAKVSFSDQSSPSGTTFSYNWDFGDGKTSSLQNPSNNYYNTGSYHVRLKIADSYGCVSEKEVKNYISVDSVIADFEFIRTDSCNPSTAEMINKSFPSSGLNYYWDFGNQSTSNAKNPVANYTKDGTFTISLSVSKGNCYSLATKKIKIYPLPDASFSIDTALHCKAPFTVNFTSKNNSDISYQWDFGDGKSSSLPVTSHTYQNYGTYSISLTATSKEGCKAVNTLKNLIQSQRPVFTVELNQHKGCKPLTIRYTITDSSLVKMTSWLIYSGHGSTRTKLTDTITYPDSGIFELTVIGSNARGCQLVRKTKIYVGIPPQADFKENHYIGCRDTNLQFINLTNTHQPKADSFVWYFGDQTTVNTEHASHKFVDTGWMSVRMVAFKYGCPAEKEIDSMIYIFPPVAVIGVDPFHCEEKVIDFQNKTKGGHLWHWDFGDTTSSTDKFVSHKYKSGTYVITLTVKDTINRCIDTAKAKIIVRKSPADDFQANKKYACPGTKISFSDTSTSQLFYYWTLANEAYSTNQFPEYQYNSGGKYTISLRVTDSFGCQTTITKKDYIQISAIEPDIIVSATEGCIPLTVNINDNSTSLFPIVKRNWFMGDGVNFNTYDSDTQYTYTKTDTSKAQKMGYLLSLYVYDSIGCGANKWVKIVPARPVARFNAEITNRCNETEMILSALPEEKYVIFPARIRWYFNGKLADTSAVVRNIFQKDTVLFVSLVLEDKFGCRDSVSEYININNKPLSADFSYSLTHTANNCPPVISNFYNQSKAGKKPIKSYYWDFGNGSVSTAVHPSTTYTYPGSYSVMLVAEDESGCKDTMIKKDIIKVNGATGSFHAWPVEACGSLESRFFPHTTPVVRYFWNFGDGGFSNDSAPVYKYCYGGKYFPSLIVEDSLGCLTQIKTEQKMTVYNNPHVSFTTQGRLSCLGSPTKFVNKTWHEQKIVYWEWNLGNGLVFNDFEPVYTYTDTGIFGVWLKAVDSAGCRDSLFLPAVVKVYLDDIKPETPFLYYVTHLPGTPLDQLIFSANQENDFKNYSVFRTDRNKSVFSVRNTQNDIRDTILTDTLFNGIQPQCYYLTASDYCLNESEESRLHCLIHLDVTALELGNQLTWTPYVGWDSVLKYSILRDEGKDFKLIHEVSGNITDYLDTNVICGEKYSYLVEAYQYEKPFLISRSNISGVTAQNKMWIAPVDIRRVSVEDEKVLIEWEDTSLAYPFQYLLMRSIENWPHEIIAWLPPNQTEFIDPNVSVSEKSYTYQLKILQTKCGISGKPGNIGKTILLKKNISAADDQLCLTWNDYTYWPEGIERYDIEYQNSMNIVPEKIGSVGNDSNVFYHSFNSLIPVHFYRITAIRERHPDIVSHSNQISVKIIPKISIPNSFTPNGDGLNDNFSPVCYGYQPVRIQIFNRWGEKIFEENEDFIGWDGKYKGEACPPGVYIYVIHVELGGEKETFTGTLTLLR